MKKSITRWAALGAATVVGAALLAPLGGIAQAAGGIQVHYYVAKKNGLPAAIYNYSTGARLSPSNAIVRDLEASRDGSRLVDLEAAIDGTGNQLQTIRVYDASGHPLNPVASVYSYIGDLYGPTISPDGTVVVWTRSDASGSKLYAKNLATGTTAQIGTGLFDPTFATPSTLIVADNNGTKYSLPVGGGTAQAIPSLSPLASGFTVSPDGSKIAWHQHHETVGTEHSPGDVAIAPLFTSGGTVSIGTVKTLATGEDNYAPAFTRDGKNVLFVHADHADIHFAGQVQKVPADGSSAPVVVDGTVLGAVVTQAIGEVPPVSVLTQPTPVPAVLAGTSATVKWSKPADADVSQVLVRRFYNGTLQKYKFVPLPTTSWTDTGLVVGRIYKYTFTSVDRGGRQSTATVPARNLIATTSLPSASDPTSTATAKAPFMVRFGSAPTTAKWTVDYRVNSGSTWTRWLTDATGSSTRTFSAALAGRTYQFRAKAKYSNGDSTATITGGRTVVPLNQTAATLSGGTTVANTAAWLGSYRKLTSTSSYAKITLTGNRLQVIAWRCSGCGSFALYENGVRIATVSTYSSTTKARSVVFTRTYSSNVTKSFAIKPLGTAGRPAILLDGFAMRR